MNKSELAVRKKVGETEPIKIVKYPLGYAVLIFDGDHYESVGPPTTKEEAEQTARRLAGRRGPLVGRSEPARRSSLRSYVWPTVAGILILLGFAGEMYVTHLDQEWWSRCQGREINFLEAAYTTTPRPHKGTKFIFGSAECY